MKSKLSLIYRLTLTALMIFFAGLTWYSIYTGNYTDKQSAYLIAAQFSVGILGCGTMVYEWFYPFNRNKAGELTS